MNLEERGKKIKEKKRDALSVNISGNFCHPHECDLVKKNTKKEIKHEKEISETKKKKTEKAEK